jgi:hypothetical protein
MSFVAPRPVGFQSPRFALLGARSDAAVRLKLMSSGDGWSLVSPDGEVVFHALGTRARRRCLEVAQAKGVLTVLS